MHARPLTSPSRRRREGASPLRSTVETRFDYLSSVPSLPSSQDRSGTANLSVLRAENERLKMELEAKKRLGARLEAELAALSQLHESQRKADANQRAEAESILRNRIRENENQLGHLRSRVSDGTAEVEELRVHASRLESELHEARLALEIARQQAARGLEAAATVQRLAADKQELQEQLLAAQTADKSRIMEGKVEALSQALEDQIAKYDVQATQVSSLLADVEALRRDKANLEAQLQDQERLQGEWIAVTDELRYRLRRQEELLQSSKEATTREVAAARQQVSDKDDMLNALQRTVDELHNELRTYRRQSSSNEVKMEEHNSQMKMARSELDTLRRELGEAKKETVMLNDRLRQSHSEREASEGQLAKLRTLSESLTSEVNSLKHANSVLERTLDELREDFHTSQRTLDDERSKFNTEHQKLLAVLGTSTRNAAQQLQQQQQTSVAANHAAAPAARRSVLSPQRPITL